MFFKTMFVIICAAFIGCQTETTGSNEPPEDVTETAYYHIIFHYNITDQSVDIAVPTTENFAVPDCTDDRIGFEMPDGRPFVEWNISPYGTETSYKAGDLFNKQKKGTVTTLYAIWKDADNEPYDVEYDPNGGLGEMKRSTLFIDRSKRLPKCTFKAPTGKRFDCWNTKSDGLGKSYKDEETVTNLTAKGKTITLYAQWNNKEYYIVRFSDEQLDTQTDDLTFDNAKAVKPLPTLTKPGYAFGGWYDSTSDSGEHVTDTNSFSDDVTVYARWTANTYTVIFDKDAADAVGSMDEQNMTYGEGAALTANAYIRAGYRFLGWHTESGASSPMYANMQPVVNLTSEADGTVTLYAVWEEADTYTIVFNANGGSGDMDQVIYVIDEDTVLPKCAFKAPAGQSFSHWNTASDDTGTSYNNMQSLNGIAEKNETVTLYAQWIDRAFYIAYLNDEERHTETADLTFDKMHDVELPVPSLTGNTFLGWYKDAELTDGPIAGWTAGEVTDDITLYAHWELKTITYTFDPHGGSWGSSTDNKTVSGKFGTTVGDVPANPTRDGYTFSGWDMPIPDVFGDSNLTFTAGYLPYTYTVVFDKNGGVGTMSNQTMSYDMPKNLTANQFTRTNWTFCGWNTKSDGSGEFYADNASVSNLTSTNGATVTLYALWSSAAVKDIGYFRYSDGSYSTQYIKNKTIEGIVFEAGTKVKVVTAVRDYAKWCAKDTVQSATNISTSDSDGSGNWAKVASACSCAGWYPTSSDNDAFERAGARGSTGMYLPAIEELQSVYDNITAINNAFDIWYNAVRYTDDSIAGKLPLTGSTSSYWSSSAVSSSSTSYYLNFNGGTKASAARNQYKSCFGVKAFGN